MIRTVSARHGPVYISRGDTMQVKLEGADTGGDYTLIEETIKPSFGAALELHRRHRETYYVIDGEITFTVGSRSVRATPGMAIHVPPNTPHAAQSDRVSRMLTVISPAGLEGALKAFAALTPAEAQDPSVGQAILDEYDIVELAQPPFPALLGFYDSLAAGDATALREIFAGHPGIDAPLEGRIRGEAALAEFVRAQQDWLSAYRARPEFVDVTSSPERIIVEFVLYMNKDDETFDLPVALAADLAAEAVSAIRMYHSTWPLTGAHRVRAPLLPPPGIKLDEPAVVQAYMAGLQEGNQHFVFSLFAGDGYVREPSGSRFKHMGAGGLARFYGSALGAGGIVLHHRTATCDAHACAVEYVCDEWANVALSPQAGLAVYEVAGPAKIRAARIYDDIAPPFD
jgi:mannose-6-phosphate isomerase-like protein (cupin superfamily)